MNVLLTSAGRRTSLTRAFQSAAHTLGGRVWAGDMDPLAAALQVADESVVLPPVDSSEYTSVLTEHVHTHEIDLLVPLIDTELGILAEAREQFREAGCHLLTSNASLIDLTFDKWASLQHFSAQQIRTPATWRPDHSSPDEWPDPVFVKPRRGSASQNACQMSRDKAARAVSGLDAPIVQEVITAPEITVDALFDLEGTLIHYVPRLRIRTEAGESIQGRTLPHDEWAPWLERVLRRVGSLGARGPITMQAFRTEPDPTFSEINPRFGGGFPLAHAAGARYPTWILEMCSGTSISPRFGDYTEGLCMTRAYTEWFVESSALDD